MLKAFYKLNRKAAKGVDNLGWFEYQKNAKQNTRALHEKLQSGQYNARPVKRLWIPKPNGEKRPIGITAMEDKIVQKALVNEKSLRSACEKLKCQRPSGLAACPKMFH